MAKHTGISPEEAADRLAIRELIEAYAHCADRRDAKGSDGTLYSRHPFRGVHGSQRSDALTGTALARGSRSGLRRPQSVRCDYALTWTDDDPVSDPRPRHGRNLLHAPSPHDRRRKPTPDDCRSPLHTDTFVKMDGTWLFAERKLYVDWLEQRELS